MLFSIENTSILGAPNNSVPQVPNSAIKKPNKLADAISAGSAAEIYLKAREYFAAGRYVDAIKYANAARKKNRNLTLANVLIAQSYYRLGDARNAAQMFIRISLDDIPKEAAIDYLLSMYTMRRYREVIKSYPLVPDQHPYKDVAKFYTGVSLLQFRLLQKAQLYIRNSKRLPSELKSQRRRILSEINQALKQERQGQFENQQFSYQNQQAYLPPPVAPEAYMPPSPGGTAPVAPTKPKETPEPPPKASTKVSAKPSFTYKQSSVRRDNSGFKLTQTDEKTPEASLNLAVKFLGKPRSFGAQPSIDLFATPGYSQTDKITSTSELSADEADPTAIINKTSKTESSTYAIKQVFGFSGFYPVNDPFDLSASYKMSSAEGGGTGGKSKTESSDTDLGAIFEAGNLKLELGYNINQSRDKQKPDSKAGSSTVKAEIEREGENSATSFEVSKSDNSKPELSGDIKSTMTLSLRWNRNFEDFSLNLEASKIDKTRLPDKAALAILNQNTIKMDGNYNLSFGLSLNGSFSYFQFSNIVVKGEESESMASGTGKQYSGAIKLAPFSYFSFSASYDVTDRDLSVADPTLAKTLRQGMWSQQIKTSLSISTNYTF